MSKTKKLKQKTTAFDIIFRVVTALMAALMYPLFCLLDLIYIQMDHKAIADLLGSIAGNEAPDLGITYERISLIELFDYIQLAKSFGGDDADLSFLSDPIYRPLIASIVFLVIALVLGLVILGFAIFSNKAAVITGLSGAGFVASVISFFTFSEGFAAPIISGKVTVAQLMGQEKGNLLDIVFGFVGDITFINLEDAFFAVAFLMLGILVWSVSVLIVNKGEEKEKAMKKAERQRQ